MESLEFVSMTDDDRVIDSLLRWKMNGLWTPDRSNGASLWQHNRDDALTCAAALSAYHSAHQHKLLAQDATSTSVPGSRALIEVTVRLARMLDWPVPTINRLAAEATPHSQRQARREARMNLGSEHWQIADAVAQPVLVIDDVYATGASMWSFAKALRDQGAPRVRGVALVRWASGTVYREHLADLRAKHGISEWQWNPERRVVRNH
jgi:hypothetical protein